MLATRSRRPARPVPASPGAFPAPSSLTSTQAASSVCRIRSVQWCAWLWRSTLVTPSRTAQSLNNLAGLYAEQGQYEQAEPLYQRALAIREQQLGPLHPHTATSLNNLAGLYKAQGQYEQAEPLYQRALAIREQQLGPLHPHTAASLNNLALLYKVQGKYEQAEPLYQRALAICEQQLGPSHSSTTTIRKNYASLLRMTQREDKDM